MNCESFIYTKQNALSSKLCNSFIETYKNSDIKRPGTVYMPGEGSSQKGSKKSTDITFNPSFKDNKEWKGLLGELIPIIKKNIDIYSQKYFTVFDKGILNGFVVPVKMDKYFNLQHYKPGEGFFNWHCERGGGSDNSRVLTWMFFLNDVTDKGGTEFHYQKHTEPAEQGKMVIFSSEYMHLHRGISSPTQHKYILTGWGVFGDQNLNTNG